MASEIGLAEEFLGVLLQTERSSPTDLRTYQAELLTRLVQHAFTNVPFYADRGDPPARMDARSEAWTQQPFMSRRDLTERGDELRSRQFPKSHGLIAPTFTGGSTGPSARRDLSTLEALGRFGVSYRMFAAWGLDQTRDLCWLRKPRPPSTMNFDRWGFPWRPEAELGRRHAMDIASPALEQLDLITKHAPVYVHTLPSNVLRLVTEARRTGLRPRILNILTVGEYLPPEISSAALDTLGAQTIDVFSSAEGGVTAIQCPDSGLYHIQSEIILVEILSDDGEAAQPGEVGELVVTPLYSYATPILRYRTGDFVEAGPPCPCGRCLPNIARMVGRREHMFRFQDGRSALPAIDRVAISERLGHDRWLLVQTTRKTAEFRVAGDVSADHRRKIVAHVDAALKGEFEVVIATVETLPLTSGSKRHFTLNAMPS